MSMKLLTNYNDAKKQLNKCVNLDGLPPEQARVEIAKDVLAAIDVNAWEPGNGYFYLRHYRPKGGELKDAVLKSLINDRPPTGCAVGGLFLAIVARKNEFKEETTLDEILKYMRQFFSIEQLAMIESAYECYPRGPIADRITNSELALPDFEETIQRCAKFSSLRTPHRRRMRIILNNIIENNGTFVP